MAEKHNQLGNAASSSTPRVWPNPAQRLARQSVSVRAFPGKPIHAITPTCKRLRPALTNKSPAEGANLVKTVLTP